MIATWPAAGDVDEDAEDVMQLVMDTVRAIRNARAEYNVQPARRIVAQIAAGEKSDLLSSQRDVLVELARLDPDSLRVSHTLLEEPEQALTLVVGGIEIYLPLAGMVDLDAERARLGNELARLEDSIARSQKLLSNEGFTAKAPAEVVDKEQEKLTSLQEQAERLRERLSALAG